MKKFGLRIWFPHPNSWLNALMLTVFMTVFVTLIKRNNGLWLNLARFSDSPELLTILVVFLLILPIPAIAFLHHFFLSLFIPAIPGEKINKTHGFVPGLISWKESLYSWLVLILSTLTVILLCTPLLPLFRLNYNQVISENGQNYRYIRAIFGIFWLISATIFYEIEYLFKCRLVFGSTVKESESTKIPASEVEKENLTETPTVIVTDQASKQKPTKIDIKKYGKLTKQIFTLILISLVGLWIYSFAKLPELQQSISANISAENPLTATSSKTAPVDENYEQAINKARRAAKLARLAQSEDEWKVVVTNWDEAIAQLKSIPPTSPSYGIAQQKIIQYQIHREFALQYSIGIN